MAARGAEADSRAALAARYDCPPIPPKGWTFTQGFLFGQGSMILIAVLFLRYVVFEDPKIAAQEEKRLRKARKQQARHMRKLSADQKQQKGGAIPTPASHSHPDILHKLSYDLASHPSESLDWLNVFIAQAVSGYRSLIYGRSSDGGAVGGGSGGATVGEHAVNVTGKGIGSGSASVGSRLGAKVFMEEMLNGGRAPGEEPEGGMGFVGVDYINVTEVDFGEQYPSLSNARLRPADASGRTRIDIDVDYTDRVILGVETKVLINFPVPKFAILPVKLGLELKRFSGTLSLEFAPSTSPNSPPKLLFSLHPDFTFHLVTTSLLGSRAKLQDIPKVEQLIIGRVRGWITDNLVWPKNKEAKFPDLRPDRDEEKEGQEKGGRKRKGKGKGRIEVPEGWDIQPGTDDWEWIERAEMERKRELGLVDGDDEEGDMGMEYSQGPGGNMLGLADPYAYGNAEAEEPAQDVFVRKKERSGLALGVPEVEPDEDGLQFGSNHHYHYSNRRGGSQRRTRGSAEPSSYFGSPQPPPPPLPQPGPSVPITSTASLPNKRTPSHSTTVGGMVSNPSPGYVPYPLPRPNGLHPGGWNGGYGPPSTRSSSNGGVGVGLSIRSPGGGLGGLSPMDSLRYRGGLGAQAGMGGGGGKRVGVGSGSGLGGGGGVGSKVIDD